MIHIVNRVLYQIMFIFIVCFTFSCSSKESQQSTNSFSKIIDNEMWNPYIILTNKEKKMVEAKSSKLYKQKDKSALLVGKVEIDFYNDSGNHMSILYADSARINERNSNLSAQ